MPLNLVEHVPRSVYFIFLQRNKLDLLDLLLFWWTFSWLYFKLSRALLLGWCFSLLGWAVQGRMLVDIFLEILAIILQPLDDLLHDDPWSYSTRLQQVFRGHVDERLPVEQLPDDYVMDVVHEKLLLVCILLPVNHFYTSFASQFWTFLGIWSYNYSGKSISPFKWIDLNIYSYRRALLFLGNLNWIPSKFQ